MSVTERGHDWEGALEHVGLAKKLADRRARKSRVPFDDLFQVAMLSFARALPLFDPDRGVAVSTYIGRAAVFEMMSLENELVPAVRVPIRYAEPLAPLRSRRDPAPADAVTEGGELEIEEREESERLYRGLLAIESKYRNLLCAAYGIERERLSQAEIAHRVGITRQGVNQRLKTARDRLTRAMAKEG